MGSVPYQGQRIVPDQSKLCLVLGVCAVTFMLTLSSFRLVLRLADIIPGFGVGTYRIYSLYYLALAALTTTLTSYFCSLPLRACTYTYR